MQLLLDTHALIWWLENRVRALSPRAREAIEAPGNTIYVSAVSAYEIAFKVTIEKLPSCAALVPRFSETLLLAGFRHLEATTRHGIEAGRMPVAIHRDPFDRILAAQAIVERMAIVSNDEKLAALGAELLW